MPTFDYRKCTQLDQAIQILGEGGQVRPLAGGTDLVVGIRGGKYKVQSLLDIKDIAELKVLKEDKSGVTIGAGVTLNEVVAFAPVRANAPILAEACHSIGSYSIRNRATLAGNICNASPAADTAAALYCLGAVVNVTGPKKNRNILRNRSIPIEKFFTGPGQTALQEGELVVSVLIPSPYPSGKGVYLKASRTGSVDLATVGVAVQLWDGEVRVALGAVAPTPIRAVSVEKAVNQEKIKDLAQAADRVKIDISPITDLRGSREYRYHLAEVLVRRGLEQVLGGAR